MIKWDAFRSHISTCISQRHRETNFHLQEFPCHLLTFCGMSKWEVGWTTAAVMDWSHLLFVVIHHVSDWLCHLRLQASHCLLLSFISRRWWEHSGTWFYWDTFSHILGSVYIIISFFREKLEEEVGTEHVQRKILFSVGTDKEQTTYRTCTCGRKCNSSDFRNTGEKDDG